MKKSKIISLGLVGVAALLASCGNPSESNTTTTGSTPVASTPVVSTPAPTTPVDDSYKVSVVYAKDNKPVTGVKVQWCNAAGCMAPVKVDQNGVAKLEYHNNATFEVHVNDVPEGYTYNPYEVQSSVNNKDVTVHVYEIGTKTGSGTDSAPYVIGEGYYTTTSIKKNDPQYYVISGLAAGTYTLETYAASVSGTIDTEIGLVSNGDITPVGTVVNKENAKYEFVVTEGQTITVALLNATDNSDFTFSVVKK